MTVSLMNMLGGIVAPAGAKLGDGAGGMILGSEGGAAFNNAMAATDTQGISIEQLRSFFVTHGAKIPAALNNSEGQTATQVLAQMFSAQDGKKLPGDMALALQEILPQEMVATIKTALDNLQGTAAAELQSDNTINTDLLEQLPQRELTPEELSQLVQETGLPPIVIFAALQDTPAASPNLAFAMVEDMGAAEADANLPLPRVTPNQAAASSALDTGLKANVGQVADAASKNNDAQQPAAQASAAENKNALGAQLTSQLAAVDFSAMEQNKRDVIKRMVEVLRGNAEQSEFNLNGQAKQAAANGNEKSAEMLAKATPNANAKANVAQPAPQMPTFVATNDATATASPNGQPQQQAALNAEGVMLQQAARSNGDNPTQPAPQTASQATDAPQQNTFAASLEQSSALRGAGTSDTMNAHLRHQPQAQQPAPADQVAVHISKAIADGSSKMEIQLKPHEMGRVDVRIETDSDGRSQVIVTADKRDTLEMLQRDARGLERALADAGLKTDSNSLSFNLRGGDGQQHAQSERDNNSNKPAFDMNANYAQIDEKLGESEMALTYDAGRAYRLNVDWGLDISV
ncbi:MAG: flagellar hook-length control protein FliK [Alphaproteobacteria bacterium]|nr:flagellar hook-length control protein FliK [Alphaproteobacteria bacterium]